MSKEMLINTVAGQECRIAIVSDGGLEELYVERTSTASRVGNIYKARVTNVESSIQAAFVDTGLGKNGFLHISDINPTYFPKNKRTVENVGQKRSHHYRPPIQECLRRGQEVVVQMIKEGIGTKGPTMTTYLSIPGRLLVMMPGMSRLGVSRKVDDEEARDKARNALSELTLPSDMGFIVRTAGVDRSKRDLQRDLNYLLRLWKVVKQQIKHAPMPSEIYQESDLVTRTIRDVYSAEIERVVCDSAPVARQVEQFLRVAVPRGKHSVELYTGKEGLYYEVGLEAEIEKIHARRVELPMGGSLIFDQTEALVAIDVNSGRFRQHSDAETTALNINLQAAREIARQLRLRDMGGMIVIDFIDMREEKNRRQLERILKDAMKPDRAKTKVLRTNAFGIIALTRQRLGPSLKQSYFNICSQCDGLGVVQSEESLSLKIARNIQRASADDNVAHIEAVVPPEVAHFLLNRQRLLISQLEAQTGKTIVVRADSEVGSGNGTILCTNARGAPVAWEQRGVAKSAKSPLPTIPVADMQLLAESAPAETKAHAGAAALSGGGAQLPASVRGGAYAEIDFDEIEAQQDDQSDAGLDRAIDANSQTNQRDGTDGEATVGEGAVVKKKRRGRRGGRKHRRRREAATEAAKADADQQADQPQPEPEQTKQAQGQSEIAKPKDAQAGETDESAPPKKKRRRRRRRKSHSTEAATDGTQKAQDATAESQAEAKPAQQAPQPAPQEKLAERVAEAKVVQQAKAAQPTPQAIPAERAPETKPAQQATPAERAPEAEPTPPAKSAEVAIASKESKKAPVKAARKPAAKRAKRTRRKKVAVSKPAANAEEPSKPPAKPESAKPASSGDKSDTGEKTADEPPKPKAKKVRRRRTKKAVATEKPAAKKKSDAAKPDADKSDSQD